MSHEQLGANGLILPGDGEKRRVSDIGQALREIVRALCVLALLFLNFGHAQAAATVGYSADLTPYLVSGAALAPLCQQTGQDKPQSGHPPCHACRIGAVAALPTPPCVGTPAFLAAVLIVHASPRQPVVARHQRHMRGPRAPPLV